MGIALRAHCKRPHEQVVCGAARRSLEARFTMKPKGEAGRRKSSQREEQQNDQRAFRETLESCSLQKTPFPTDIRRFHEERKSAVIWTPLASPPHRQIQSNEPLVPRLEPQTERSALVCGATLRRTHWCHAVSTAHAFGPGRCRHSRNMKQEKGGTSCKQGGEKSAPPTQFDCHVTDFLPCWRFPEIWSGWVKRNVWSPGFSVNHRASDR